MEPCWKREIVKVFLATLLLVVFSSPVSTSAQQRSEPPSARSKAENSEDWAILSLSKSDLRPEKPVFGERIETPRFTRELIQVKWRSGDPIDLYVIKPKNVPRAPVILYLYSYPSETDRFRDDRYCERITAGGFAGIGFVSALTGHRYQNRPMKQWFVSELQESLASSVHDVQMILNYLGTRDDLDLGRVGMFATGSGGSIAILAASVDARIKAIDLLDPWGDWPDWLAGSGIIPEEERSSYLKPECLEKVSPLDPVQYLPRLTQRVRIEDVMDDTVTPKTSKDRIEAAAPKTAEIKRFDTTKEFLGALGGGRIFQWLKLQLQAQPAQKAMQNP
jgi:hypothetical protein